MTVSITKTFEFAASHRLFRPEWSDEQNFQMFGKCANRAGHGHNYRLEVTVCGPIDAETGMILDASSLQSIVEDRVLKDVDHKHLCHDVPWLEGEIATVENLCERFWERLETAIDSLASSHSEADRSPASTRQSGSLRLRRLVLWETSRIYAEKEWDHEKR